jgi:hypothetical protein
MENILGHCLSRIFVRRRSKVHPRMCSLARMCTLTRICSLNTRICSLLKLSGGAGRCGDYFDEGRGRVFPYFPLFLTFFQAALEGAGIIPMKGEGGFFLIGDTRNVEVPQVPKCFFSLLFLPPSFLPHSLPPHTGVPDMSTPAMPVTINNQR